MTLTNNWYLWTVACVLGVIAGTIGLAFTVS